MCRTLTLRQQKKLMGYRLFCCCVLSFFGLGHFFLILIIGDPSGDGWIDRVHQFFRYKVVAWYKTVLRRLCGAKGVELHEGFTHYLFSTNNSVVQVRYIA